MPFPSKASRTQGLQVQIDDPVGSGAGFKTIAEVTKNGFSGGKLDMIKVTNQDSQGGHDEYIAGLIESGDFDIEGNYLGNQDDSGTQALLNATLENAVRANFQVVIPPGPNETSSRGTWSFAAYVSSFDCDFPIDKQATFKCKLKITGPRTFTP